MEEIMKKKRVFSLLAVVLSLVLLVGCGSSNNGDDVFNDGTQQESNVPEGRTQITFWHSWGSDSKAYLQKVVDAFNASQSNYYVVLQFVGDKNDLHAKLQVTAEKDRPALINTTTEMVGAYLYSDYTVPIYELADGSDEDQWYLDRVYDYVVGTWGDSNGNLLGYPMGNSMSGAYFNLDIMEQAGIDPYEDFKSVEDLYDICKKLVDGNYVEYAIGTEHTGRFLNYSLALQGLQAFDNESGRTGIPTKSFYATGEVGTYAEKFLQTFVDLQEDGLSYSQGSSWGNELLPAYSQGKIAILTGSLGGYGRLERAWKEANPDEEFNTCFVPWVPVTDEASPNGQPASGYGFYVIDHENDVLEKGAWEFIKYITTGETYAGWCLVTGYLPISDDVYQTQAYQEYVSEHKAFGIDYLMDVQRNDDGSIYHPISAIYTQTSALAETALTQSLAGGDIKAILQTLETETTDALSMWALANS